MDIASWLCMNNTKALFVRIVHPGGHIELHDRPVMAAEVMLRNPRCCVAYPHVFKQPTAILTRETILMPGQKFYVVPVSTIKKLQRKMRRYPSLPQDVHTSHQQHCTEHVNTNNDTSPCCSFWNSFWDMDSPKQPYCSLEQSNPKVDSCFSGFLRGINIKSNDADGVSSANNSPAGRSNSETKLCSARKSCDQSGWQPNLQSITE